MFTKEYVSKDYRVFEITEPLSEVKKEIAGFKFSHLFVAKEGVYVGGLPVDLLMAAKGSTLADLETHLTRFFIFEESAMIDSIRVFYNFNSNIVPVIDEKEHYTGYITALDLCADLSKYPFFSEDGAVLIVEKEVRDFSMTEISKIFEDHMVRFFGAFICRIAEKQVQVALKFSAEDAATIEAGLDRSGYRILHKFYKDPSKNLLKDRFDFLQKYMKI